MRILGKVSYKGTCYQGWQRQTNANSIQEEIETAISKILDNETKIYGSGRTDAGVHAKGQTFHFELEKDIDLNKLRYSLNCVLPSDIHIIELKEVCEDFHARFNAKEKHYSYSISVGENDPFNNEICLSYLKSFDLETFKVAISCFNGEYCFQDFTSKEEDEKNFIRKVQTEVIQQENIIKVHFYGDGFMRYMIRFMVGTALAVMEKKVSVDFIQSHLNNNGKRDIVSYKAAPQGLVLEEVKY